MEEKVVEDTLLQAKIGFIPHKFQAEVLRAFDDPKIREVVVSAGRRGGKSSLCAYIILRELFSSGKRCMVLSPSYDLTNRVLDYVKGWIRKFGAISIKEKPYPIIKMPESLGGSWVKGCSAESPAGILGEEYDLVVIDEAPLIDRKIQESYIYPATAGRRGKKIYIGTPRRKDWYFERYQYCSQNPDGASFTWTSKDNPFFPSEEWDIAQKKLPKGIFDREFKAVFSDETTSIFRNIYELLDPDLPREAKEKHFHYAGLDLAKEQDFSAIVIIDRNTDPYEIVFADKWQKLDYPAQKQRIIGIIERFKPCRVVIDSRNVGAMMGESLRREGIFVEDWISSGTLSKDWRKKGSKEKLVEHTISLFESRAIKLPDYKPLLDELSSFGYRITDSGNIKYGVPQGLHDDLTDALMMALWNCRLKGRKKKKTAFEKRKEEYRRFRRFQQDSSI